MSSASERFQQKTYDKLKKELTGVISKIKNYETRSLPQEPVEREKRIEQYKKEVIGTYNNFVRYSELFYGTFDLKSQLQVNEKVEILKVKVKNSLKTLGLDVDLPDELHKFDINTVKPLDPNSIGASCATVTTSSEHSGSESETEYELVEQTDTLQSRQTQQQQAITDPPLGQPNLQNDPLLGNKNTNIQNPNTNDSVPTAQLPLNNENQLPIDTNNAENPNNTMALSPGDILKGIPDFDSKSQESIKKFMAQVDLMYLLAPNGNDTIIAVTKAKLVNATKLGNMEDKTWAQIKDDIKLKYRTQMTYEVAQEKLLSLQQGPKETLESYANRVRTLLDALNLVTVHDNADIQASNRTMNENLAVRKFKQNFFNEELRVIAVGADHTNLNDAIAHASSKSESLLASNLQRAPIKETDKKGPEPEQKPAPKQTNWKKSKGHYNNKNKDNTNACNHCKKSNHSTDQCFFRPGGPGANKTGDNETKNKQANVATAAAQPADQPEPIKPTSTASLPMPSNTVNLQPYHYLNY